MGKNAKFKLKNAIQIQHLLKLNFKQRVFFYDNLYSNTTLVKVKLATTNSMLLNVRNSNTTLVKVKLKKVPSPQTKHPIQIQHLLKLNFMIQYLLRRGL